MSLSEIEMTAVLSVEDGRLKGIALFSVSNEGEQLIADLLSGSVDGLPFCKNTPVMPVAVSRDRYLIKVDHQGPPPTGNPAID